MTATTTADPSHQRSLTAAIFQANIPESQAVESNGPALPTHPSLKVPAGTPATVDLVIEEYKAVNTWLYVSLSTNDYGETALRLQSCLNDTYFDSILKAWGLDKHKDDVAVVIVNSDWPGQGALVVREGVRDSWLKVVQVIDEAPVWEDGKGKCDVKVRIIVK